MPITLIENFRAVFYTPFYASFALKAYEAEQVEVQRVMSERPAETMQAVLRGEGDVAWGGPIRLLKGDNKRTEGGLAIFCDVVGRDPFFLLGREPNSTYQPRDLLGKKMAAVSEVPTPWLCLQHDLRAADLDPADIDRTPERTMPENVEALRAGEVDVIQCFQPYVEQVLAEQLGHIWYAASDRGPTAYTAMYAPQSLLDDKPDEFLRMTRAVYRTQAWIASHEAVDLAELVADFFPDVPLVRLTSALARYKQLGLWNQTPIMPQEGFEWLKAACLSGGFIDRDVAFEQCVDMRFAEQVIQETPEPL